MLNFYFIVQNMKLPYGSSRAGLCNGLLWERVTTELPIGSELANTFENKFIYEQLPQNLYKGRN